MNYLINVINRPVLPDLFADIVKLRIFAMCFS